MIDGWLHRPRQRCRRFLQSKQMKLHMKYSIGRLHGVDFERLQNIFLSLRSLPTLFKGNATSRLKHTPLIKNVSVTKWTPIRKILYGHSQTVQKPVTIWDKISDYLNLFVISFPLTPVMPCKLQRPQLKWDFV